jgi:hypothetical protein
MYRLRHLLAFQRRAFVNIDWTIDVDVIPGREVTWSVSPDATLAYDVYLLGRPPASAGSTSIGRDRRALGAA